MIFARHPVLHYMQRLNDEWVLTFGIEDPGSLPSAFQRGAELEEADDVNSWFDYARSGGYLRHCIERFKEYRQEYEDLLAGTKHLRDERSHEYGSYIIEAVETNKLAKINGNVPNHGLIDNLPEGCCVEVPCLVDGNGIQPVKVGNLPAQLAALNRTMVNVQSLIVEASLTGDTEAIKYAISLDPLTAAVCTLDQISAMSDEMYAAQKQWLPQFE